MFTAPTARRPRRSCCERPPIGVEVLVSRRRARARCATAPTLATGRRGCSRRGAGACARRPRSTRRAARTGPRGRTRRPGAARRSRRARSGRRRRDTISESWMLGGGAGQHVAAADAALGAHQPGALEGEQDLLEVRLGQAGALGDVAHRRRSRLVGVQGERQQRPAGVVTSGRDPHAHLRHGTGRPGVPAPCER